MAGYTTLKTNIQNVIKTNGNREITGAIMQNALISMINEIANGSVFRGLAIPSTNPGTTDGNQFYFAIQKGSYANFGNYTHTGDGIVIFDNKTGTWVATKLNHDGSSFMGMAIPTTNPGTSNNSQFYFATQKGSYVYFNSYQHDGGLVIFDNRSGVWTPTMIPLGGDGIDTQSLIDNQVFIWDSYSGSLKQYIQRTMTSVPLSSHPNGFYFVQDDGIYVVENGIVKKMASLATSTSLPTVAAFSPSHMLNTVRGCFNINTLSTPARLELTANIHVFQPPSVSFTIPPCTVNFETVDTSTGRWFIIAGLISGTPSIRCWHLSRYSQMIETVTNPVCVGQFYYSQPVNPPYVFEVQGLSSMNHDIKINGKYICGCDGSVMSHNSNLFDPLAITEKTQINVANGTLQTSLIRSVSGIMTGIVPNGRYIITGLPLMGTCGMRFLDSSNNPLPPLDSVNGSPFMSSFQLPSEMVIQGGFFSPPGSVAAQFDFYDATPAEEVGFFLHSVYP